MKGLAWVSLFSSLTVRLFPPKFRGGKRLVSHTEASSHNGFLEKSRELRPLLPPLSPDVIMAMADKLHSPLVGITSILDQSTTDRPDNGSGLGLASQEAARLLELEIGRASCRETV